ncbi:hypothetical protein [Streptomyces xanthochromogenes]|uniref:hypothetical protein n=1 Tax=Streptomyces xanthochromogenes TaxID=67384 RepID=UPI001675F52A|nr:hypothetical protein [Streptomyces xanthochromogenes]
MWRPDRARLRSGGFTVLVTVVFLLVNAQVAHAAQNSGGDMLSPLNITSSEVVPINGYELSAEGGSVFSFKSNAYAFVMNGLFTLLRLVVGLACWAIGYAFKFPLLKMLTSPAQQAADAYNHAVVDSLGLKGLMLAWAFVFGLILFVRGKTGKGLGEIALTLVIAGFAASAFVRPDYLLAQGGPLAQTQQAAAEVARDTVNSHYWGGKIASDQGPCAGMAGRGELKCLQLEGAKPLSPAEVARPIQDSLTNALIVKGYMLLEYGRVLDPAKDSDKKAYALHLKWVSGGYKPENQPQKGKGDTCGLIRGVARTYCEQGAAGQVKGPDADTLPALTTGDALLQASQPVLTEEDQQFAAFLGDLKEQGGPVGKACAQYASQPTGWRTAGALMLFIASLLICAIPLSASVVLLGTQAADAGAAAVGGVAFVWGMLPGPNRQVVWKWIAVFFMSVAVMFVCCMFLPFYGIGVDVVFTDGPDLPAERLLVLDVLGIVGLACHRILMRGISSFGQRLAIRMRYAKVGGTHLPGDTSEIGAALAVHATGGGFGIGGLRSLGLHGSVGRLGTRHRLMASLASLADGAGMPVDSGRLLADAGAEASRGLAPLALAATGLRLGARGGWGLLVGRRPDDQALERWRKPTADVDSAASEAEHGGRAGGTQRRRGPADRYRDPDGTVADRDSGTLLHDQHQDRTLLSTRAHNRLVRLRGYRILHRAGRIAYGSSWGLPENLRRGGEHGSRYTHDARQQVRVWGNTVREDGRAWAQAGSGVAQRLREQPGDRGAPAPFTGRALRSAPPNSGLGAPASVTPAPPPAPPAAPPARPLASPPRPASPPATPTPPSAPPRAVGPDPAALRRRIIDRLGAGDAPEARRRIQDEMRRRFGDPDAGGDGG